MAYSGTVSKHMDILAQTHLLLGRIQPVMFWLWGRLSNLLPGYIKARPTHNHRLCLEVLEPQEPWAPWGVYWRRQPHDRCPNKGALSPGGCERGAGGMGGSQQERWDRGIRQMRKLWERWSFMKPAWTTAVTVDLKKLFSWSKISTDTFQAAQFVPGAEVYLKSLIPSRIYYSLYNGHSVVTSKHTGGMY